jgi:hypothetical protein
LRDWERDEDENKGPFRVRPVVPIVLYAAARPWGSARTLADLLGQPEVLHVFAPRWEPMFWELGNTTTQELLSNSAAIDQFLAIVRAEDEPTQEFAPVFRSVFERLYQEHCTFAELLSIRRPKA